MKTFPFGGLKMDLTPEKDHPKNKTVMLFSGGLDSYLAYRIYKPDVLLYCACNHKYQARELKAIRDLKLKDQVTVDFSLDLEKWERTDAIIPLRNLLFAAVASRYGDLIWLGALSDEINWDKSKQFMAIASITMSHCYNPSYWCDGRTIDIESPVKKFTKAQLIALALELGIKPEEWAKTVSCYSKAGFCGECSSCFKRWVAHTLNGITEKYKVDPWKTDKARENVNKLCNRTYTGQRAIEVAVALMVVGGIDWISLKKMKEDEAKAHEWFRRIEKKDFHIDHPGA
jgi:7-cyano-7-deazaguanine synthase in queuosine biosynthesis